MLMRRHFASDNNSGVHPEVLAALAKVNIGHVQGYGHDVFTEQAEKLVREQFGGDCEVFFVGNGTAANVLGIATALERWEAVICSEWAHFHVDECGAPERFLGTKVLAAPTTDGKLFPDQFKRYLTGHDDEHRSQPRIISISQATEVGTVYTPTEIKALADFAHQHNMYLHIDGARIANAAASLNVSLKAMTSDVGVDILSLGGTKNGIMFGEAIVFLNPLLANNFRYIRKQGMHLFSKMRFVAAQFLALFTNDLWLRNAMHANRMADLLFQEIAEFPQIQVSYPVESNGIFAVVPSQSIAAMQEISFFYIWDALKHEVRWMCSFDTESEDVRTFAQGIKKVLNLS